MSDWEIAAPDDASMQTAFDLCGIRNGDGFTVNHVRFCVNYYVTKSVDGVAQPGCFASVRWIAPNIPLIPFPPVGVTLPPNVTSVTLPAGSPGFF